MCCLNFVRIYHAEHCLIHLASADNTSLALIATYIFPNKFVRDGYVPFVSFSKQNEEPKHSITAI